MNEEGINKGAILLLSLGEDEAVQVLKHLNQLEVQKLGAAMAKLKNVSREQVDSVLSDFCNRAAGEQRFLDLNPEHYARTVLQRALGEDKSTDNISSILEGHDTSGIEGLRWIDSQSVAELIKGEHPQIIATILVHLDRNQA